MSVATSGRFSCETCGATYPWKPALAGKSAKCRCGAVIQIPASPTLMPAQPRQKSKPPPPLATADIPMPPPVAQVAAPAHTLGYVSARRRPSQSEELPVDKLMSDRMPLEDVNAGFDRLAAGGAIRLILTL